MRMLRRAPRAVHLGVVGLVCLVAAACAPQTPGTTTTTTTTTTVAPDPAAVQLSTASLNTCALINTGSVLCLGNNFYSQMGNGAAPGSQTPELAFVPVSGLTTATQVEISTDHGCALLADTTVSCWGRNNYGQLGNGGGANENSPVPVSVTGLTGVVAIDGGHQGTCALLSGGTVSCWGRNLNAGLGSGADATELPSSNVPLPVVGLTDVVQIEQSGSAACARHTDGTVSCWGNNGFGQLGTATADPFSAVAVTLDGITDATHITMAGGHGCAVIDDGTVRCWGRNLVGALGNGTDGNVSATPVEVIGITNAVEVTGGSLHTCARLADGTVSCWGLGTSGALGNGVFASSNIPVQVSGIATAVQVTTESQHVCALLADASAKCWGQNTSGRLGHGIATGDSNVPVDVLGLP